VAYLRYDESSGNYFIRFRYGGASINRSLKTNDRREAEAIRGRVNETILLLERGRLEMPPNADPAAFILFGFFSLFDFLQCGPVNSHDRHAARRRTGITG
jgi:hypothetical protein